LLKKVQVADDIDIDAEIRILIPRYARKHIIQFGLCCLNNFPGILEAAAIYPDGVVAIRIGNKPDRIGWKNVRGVRREIGRRIIVRRYHQFIE
jgi:hypothetical protein